MSELPNVSMNALVIQLSAVGLPPRSAPIASVATAPPEKLRGRTSAARQTAIRIGVLPVGVSAIAAAMRGSPSLSGKERRRHSSRRQAGFIAEYNWYKRPVTPLIAEKNSLI